MPLAVSITAVPNACYRNYIRSGVIEKDAIVAATKAKAQQRGLQLLYISTAIEQKAVDAMQD